MKMMNVFSIGLILIVMLASVATAEAGLRIDATLRAPGVRIHIGDGHGPRVHGNVHVRVPARMPARLAVTPRDRVVARRLSDVTGLRSRTILRLRADGLKWNRIGRILDIPRPVVRAAVNDRAWARFTYRDDRRSNCAYRR